jgi:hypothetical protein
MFRSARAYDLLALPVREVESKPSWLAAAFNVDELRAIVSEAFATRDAQVDVWSGLAGAIATAGPLAIGVAAGNRNAGLIAGIGGLNTALSVPRAGAEARMWWGVLGAVAGCLAVLLASAVSGVTVLLVLLSIIWVGLWTAFRAAGPAGVMAGFAASAVFVVIGGFPHGSPGIARRELWFALGAAAGLVLMVVARDGPEGQYPFAKTAMDAVRDAARRDLALRAHIVRLALAVGFATLIERIFHMPHGAWVPLTVLAVLQPAVHATEVRSLQRAVGTLVGVVVIIIVTAITGEVWFLVVCTAITSMALFALSERGYFWLVVTLTPTVLFMLSIADFQGYKVGVDRTLNSALGIILGLAIGEVAGRIGRAPPPVARP